MDVLVSTDRQSRVELSGRQQSQHPQRACVSSRHVSAMSRHRDRRGSSLCHQNVWGHAGLPVLLLSHRPLSPSLFASSCTETRRCFAPGMRPKCVSKKVPRLTSTVLLRARVSDREQLKWKSFLSLSLPFPTFSFCYVSLSDKREMQQWARSGPVSREGGSRRQKDGISSAQVDREIMRIDGSKAAFCQHPPIDTHIHQRDTRNDTSQSSDNGQQVFLQCLFLSSIMFSAKQRSLTAVNCIGII